MTQTSGTSTTYRPLPAGLVPGARVVRTDGRTGTITRVIDAGGAIAGLVEVRWDGERRPSRSAGFFSGDEVRPLCSGCAICDPAEAARDAASDEAWASEQSFAD